ncbi:MAG TPA: response regulator [Sphingomicrobium sp.]
MADLEGARVLVVEDEYLIADDLVRALHAAGGQAVGPAGSLDHARTLLDEEEVDAAILDLNLHGEMAFPLVSDVQKRGLPCVIMSGYSPESLPESIRHVPNLEKPVDHERVVRSLAAEIVAKSA